MPLNSPIHKRCAPGLYIVTTPIGNLADITLRAVSVLGGVDLIAAEDTRHTRRLLAAHGIVNRLVSYHEHNEVRRTADLVERLAQGAAIAIVSNAGTPTVSDPGYRLVQAAIARNITVVPIPGVSAAIAALSVSGLPTDQFIFVGFPPRGQSKRLEQLKNLAPLPLTLIFYQSPQRLLSFLRELQQIVGDRYAVLAREMTKLHEEFLRGPLSHIISELDQRKTVKGECTLLVSGAAPATAAAPQDIDVAIDAFLSDQDRPLSDIARELATKLNVSRKQVYERALEIKKLKE